MAYYDYYLRYPEIHWAFLGHMVSRNGGWNMTDLKGDLLSRLLSEKEHQKTVLQTLEFKLQDLLSLNQILFRMRKREAREQAQAEIAGMTLHQFASLHERIILGKRLYSLLFNTPSLRAA